MNGLAPTQWNELKRLMKDGVPGLPISQGGNWDITEHGFGGLYGQTAFSSRPAGAPPVDPRSTKYQLADLLTKSTTAATFSRIMPMLTGYARFDHSRYTS